MVTHRVIAEETGLSKSAVSLALAGSGKLPEKTRARVLAAARRLGHKPDAMASAYMAHLRKGRPEEARPVIAVVSRFPRAGERRRNPFYGAFMERVEARAGELGYRTEEFAVVEKRIQPERLGRIFAARRIQAVLVAPSGLAMDPLPERCGDFSVVQLAPTEGERRFHRVRPDHFGNTLLALERTAALGFGRVGLCCVGEDAVAWRREMEAAWMLASGEGARGWPRPLFLEAYDAAAVAGHVRRERVDALVCNWPEMASSRTAARAFVCLGLPSGRTEMAGVYRQDEYMDRECVDLLAALALAGDRGQPAQPKTVTFAGEWRDGASAVRRVRK